MPAQPARLLSCQLPLLRSNLRRRCARALIAACLASAVPFAAGCGGSSSHESPPPGGSPPPGSSFNRSDPVSTDPGGLVFQPVTRKLYFVGFGRGDLVEIDADTDSVSRIRTSSGGPIRAAVDASTNTLFVCNIRDDALALVDAASLDAVRSVPVGHAPRSVAVIPALQSAYVANYHGGSVSVVDLVSSSVIATIDVPEFPRAVAADPATHRVFVSSFKDDSLTEIDADTNRVVRTVRTGSLPGYVHVNPESHRVYVTDYGDDALSIFDPATGSVETTSIGPRPTGVWTNTALDVLCIACEGERSLRVLRLSDGALLGAVALKGTPQAVALDAARNRAYVADYAARRVFAVDLATRTVVAVIDLAR